jgi:hypothetical protein
MLDRKDTIHGLECNETNLSYSLKQCNDKSETKKVEKPIKSKRKCRNPKIDEKFVKNNFDWSSRSSKKNESSSSDVFEGSQKNKGYDWSTLDFDKSKTPKIAQFRPIPPVPTKRSRLTIRLVFPGGERERQEYSVNKFLSVQEFKRRLATTLLETSQPISIFVSPDWQLLDHAGCVTDQLLPGTNLNCPFLTHGSTVCVEVGN